MIPLWRIVGRLLGDCELLVGAAAFWTRAAGDIAGATRRVLAQAMTFEGDTAGRAVAAAIMASNAPDRRVLVDDYTRLVINDRWVGGRGLRLDPALRAEVAATDAMFVGLRRGGVGVRRTNPIGPGLFNYPARNHKKLIVADDVAYLGGVNFSDHNFSWPDLMVRIARPAAANWLSEDFAATYAGEARSGRLDLPGLQLLSLDGRDNRRAFSLIIDLIERSRSEIAVVSPYLTFPVTDALVRAARRGVLIRLVTPWPNNKPTVRDHLLSVARKGGFEVTLLPEMMHLKGMLIDDAALIAGSSNFDFASLASEEEFVAVFTDPAMTEGFRRDVIEPALQGPTVSPAGEVSPLRGLTSLLALKIAERIARLASGARRSAVDWGAAPG